MECLPGLHTRSFLRWIEGCLPRFVRGRGSGDIGKPKPDLAQKGVKTFSRYPRANLVANASMAKDIAPQARSALRTYRIVRDAAFHLSGDSSGRLDPRTIKVLEFRTLSGTPDLLSGFLRSLIQNGLQQLRRIQFPAAGETSPSFIGYQPMRAWLWHDHRRLASS